MSTPYHPYTIMKAESSANIIKYVSFKRRLPSLKVISSLEGYLNTFFLNWFKRCKVFSLSLCQSLSLAPSTLCRINLKTQLYCYGYGFRPH